MNKLQISILTTLGIVISAIILIISFSPNQEIVKVENLNDQETTSDENMTLEIQEKLNKIERERLENQYAPQNREWITSGPFQIDRSQYLLGEKVFLRINELQLNEKGIVSFMRPFNSTHFVSYIDIPFDGFKKESFNYYFQPNLFKSKGTCSLDDILGEWRVLFTNTQYKELSFQIINKTIPGDENKFSPVC